MTTWTGTCRARSALLGSIAAVVLAGVIVAAAGSVGAGLIVVGLTAFLLAGLVSSRVEIGPDGLEVRSGVYSFVRVRLPLGRIRHAEAIDVNPWRWGGWGYRGSVRVFKRAAWILRKGEGIKVDLVGGGWFVVSVDDAAGGAAALSQLLTSR